MGVLTGFPGKPIPGDPGFPGGPGSPASPSGPTRPGSPWKVRKNVTVSAAAGCPGSHPFTPKPPPTFWPLGPTTQISPGRPCRRGAGCEGSTWQHRAHHRLGCSSPTAQGCPRGCSGTPSTTHITPWPPRLALQSPVALLTLLALRDRQTSPMLFLMLHGWAAAGPGTHLRTQRAVVPAAGLGPMTGLTFCPLVPVGPGSPCMGTAGQSGCPWVVSCRYPRVGTRRCPLSRLLSTPAQGTHEVGWEGGTTGCPRHLQSITYRLSTLPLLALRPLSTLRRRRREEGEGGQQGGGG